MEYEGYERFYENFPLIIFPLIMVTWVVSQQLSLDGAVFLFISFVFTVEFEHIENLQKLQKHYELSIITDTDTGSYLVPTGGVVQGDHVGVLIVLLHQVQLLRNAGVVLEAVLPDLEHDLDHVLSPLVEAGLV